MCHTGTGRLFSVARGVLRAAKRLTEAGGELRRPPERWIEGVVEHADDIAACEDDTEFEGELSRDGAFL